MRMIITQYARKFTVPYFSARSPGTPQARLGTLGTKMAARNAKRSISTILRKNGGHDNEQYYQYAQLATQPSRPKDSQQFEARN